MQSNNHFITSDIFKQLLVIGLLISMIVISMGYGLLHWQGQLHQKHHVASHFEHTASCMSDSLQKSTSVQKALIKQCTTIDTAYQMVLFTPDGQTLVAHSLKEDLAEDNLNFEMPTWDKNVPDHITYRNGQMFAWKHLASDYQLYGQIAIPNHNFLHYADSPYQWLLLILSPVAIIFGMLYIIFRFFHVRYVEWKIIMAYLREVENLDYYKPIKNIRVPEYTELIQYLNRMAYHLHKQKGYLAKNRRFKRQMIEDSPGMLFLIDTKKYFEFCNSQLIQNFKLPKLRIKKFTLLDIVTPMKNDDTLLLSSLTVNPQPLRMLVKATQSKNKYDLLINPFYDDKNHLLGFAGFLHDVSRDQKKMAELELSQLEIDDRLSANERLWAVMGHELRTPLNGMLGMIQLLEDTLLDTEQQDFVTTLKSSSNSMLYLLNDMLDLSKLDAGKMESEISEIDVIKLCRETCDLMIGNARKKDIELVFFCDSDINRFLYIDPFRVRQIFLNLMGNALKFTHHGHVALLIKTVSPEHELIQKHFLKLEENQVWLRFSISDTGPGIPEEEQQQLFYFFNQANSSISRRFGGTGLGLAISKGLAEMLGGFIHLESELGKGTSFHVYLPVTVENKQPIYQCPDVIKDQPLVVFDPDALNQHYFEKLFKDFDLNFELYDTLDTEKLNHISAHINDKKTRILLIDYELFEEDKVDSLVTHAIFRNSKKLLMSFRSRRSIPTRVMAVFDGFIEKPLFMDGFFAEILRTSSEIQEAYKYDSSRKYKSNDEFMLHDIKEKSKNYQMQKTPKQSVTTANAKADTSAKTSNTSEEKLAQSAQSTPTQSKPIPEKQTGIHVLLAEDNLINRKVAKKMLEKQNCQVTIAENGEIAVEKVQQHTFALVLMDCRMPKMDGLEATRAIRKLKISIPIIALTANDTEEDRIACEESGMDDFLAKPISQAKLIEMLKDYSPEFKAQLN